MKITNWATVFGGKLLALSGEHHVEVACHALHAPFVYRSDLLTRLKHLGVTLLTALSQANRELVEVHAPLPPPLHSQADCASTRRQAVRPA